MPSLQHAVFVIFFYLSVQKRFGLAQLSMSAAVEGISITTSSNTAYELTKQVREHEDGYEPVGTPPKGPSAGSANHEGQYEVPTYPPCNIYHPLWLEQKKLMECIRVFLGNSDILYNGNWNMQKSLTNKLKKLQV